MGVRGFTLIELMIAVAILAIVAAVAIPAYNGYIRESRLGAMRMNLDTLRIAVEAFKLDSTNSTYKHATIATPSYILRSRWCLHYDNDHCRLRLVARNEPEDGLQLCRQRHDLHGLQSRGRGRRELVGSLSEESLVNPPFNAVQPAIVGPLRLHARRA